ncbi:MAG: LysR family transcriptional regulator [Eubacterium sp.]|nr:LysR family transcriptional regulator [Eubacterium sp.]
MTIIQMKYFITVARCRSFTKAAEILFVTQPALSRQINAMEKELNMQLFIRTTRQVKLTPPARILLREFEKIYDTYNLAVADAWNSFQGLSGDLNIGILEGTYMGDLFPGILTYLAQEYPNIKINLHNYSFKMLIQKLYQEELDIIFTLLFDVKDREMLEFRVIEHTKDHMVVHRDHRLADAGNVSLSDFSKDTLIMVSPDDSMESPRLILDACKTAGFTPKVRYASSLSEEMLLVEAGIGVCILDSRNTLHMNNNPSVRFLDIPTISDPSLTMAWHSQHYNPMKDVFINHFLPADNLTSV